MITDYLILCLYWLETLKSIKREVRTSLFSDTSPTPIEKHLQVEGYLMGPDDHLTKQRLSPVKDFPSSLQHPAIAKILSPSTK